MGYVFQRDMLILKLNFNGNVREVIFGKLLLHILELGLGVMFVGDGKNIDYFFI
ncbi:hypothetical protein J4437_08060 [Candidatus Woesearchaeota archaeon]|nr:hypothetical protein [Candidatus Woesearchaeota archaeon]